MSDKEWVNTAKSGDTVFVSSRNTLSKTTIRHITATMIIVNHGNSTMRFNKKSCCNSSGSRDFYNLYPDSENLRKQYQRNERESKLRSLVITIDKNIRIRTMTDEQLVRWIEILKPLEKEITDSILNKAGASE